jgi:hypothetical protein
MVNVKEENKKQINNIKEKKDFLESQKLEVENTTSTISETTNKINEILINTKKQVKILLRIVLIHQTNINKIQAKLPIQSQINLMNYKIIFLIFINQHLPNF